MLTELIVNVAYDDAGPFNDADNVVTLREAVFLTEQNGGHDTIHFAPGLDGKTIFLGRNANGGSLGFITATEAELDITEALTIEGFDPNGNLVDITIDASFGVNGADDGIDNGNGSRIFDINISNSNTVTLRGLKLTGGDVSGSGGAITFRGIANGKLAIDNSLFTENFAFNGSGGAIELSSGRLEIENSKFLNNRAEFTGGGVVIGDFSAVTTISNTDFINNQAGVSGGGLAMTLRGSLSQPQEVTITNSRFLNNRALDSSPFSSSGGGGIYANLYSFAGNTGATKAKLEIIDTTVEGNEAANNGGGIWVCSKFGAVFNLINSTVSGNTAGTVKEPDPMYGNNYLTVLGGEGGGLWVGVDNGTVSALDLDATFVNVTISGNNALSAGGGLWVGEVDDDEGKINVKLNHTTITENRVTVTEGNSPEGGGLFSQNNPKISTTLVNTIASGNIRYTSESVSSANNISGAIQNSSIYNLLGPGGNALLPSVGNPNVHDSILNDPGLYPLDTNGGPTETHLPKKLESLAVDAWDPAQVNLAATLPTNDQRGLPRVKDVEGVNDDLTPLLRVDIGAVERQDEPGVTLQGPAVIDVLLNGTGWAAEPIAFAGRVFAGQQLRSVARAGVNQLQIQFSQDTFFDNGTELTLYAKNNAVVAGVTYAGFDQANNVATWNLSGTLPVDKYHLELDSTGVSNVEGTLLDGEWKNDPGGTPSNPTYDDWSDDPTGRVLRSGGASDGGDFSFFFSYLPGDFDGNGIVESLVGDPDVQEGTVGDIDGDGEVGDNDDVVATVLLNGTSLSFLVSTADLNDDEIVDINDLIRWQQGYGTEFDGANFLFWQREYGSFSAWYDGPLNFGSATAAAISYGGFAPQVMNLIISGSASTHAPFGMDAVDGSGLQLAAVPVGGADTVSIVFSENVNVSAENLRVIGLRTFTVPTVADFSYDASTFTATWRFESWNSADHYLISVSDAVTDLDGNMLDGEWTNPASLFSTNSAISTFPSGDGTVGGVFNFVTTILPGDANLDGRVSVYDFSILQNNWGQTGALTFSDGDFNGDGSIDGLDFALLASTYGTNLQTVSVLGDLNSDGKVDDLDMHILGDNLGMTGAAWADGDMDGDGDVDIEDLDLAYAQYGLAINLVA